MTTLFSGCNTANNSGTDRIRASIMRILAGVLLCLVCGSAFGQIRMAIEVTPTNPEPGERLVVRVTVTNQGAGSTSGLELQLDFPAGLLEMDDVLLSDGGDCTNLVDQFDCESGEIAFWTIGALSGGSGKTVYLSPRVDSALSDGSEIAFSGRVFEGVSQVASSSSVASIATVRPLELAIHADREPVASSGELRYELSFGNQIGTATTETELRFPLPASTSLVEASDGGMLVGSEVVWDLGTLNPSEADKRWVTVQLDGTIDSGEVIKVDAAEISGVIDFETQRTRQQSTTRVESTSSLAFSVDMPAQPLRNDTFSPIHLTVTNRGDTTRTGVRAELFFPPGLAQMDDALLSDGGDCTDRVDSFDCESAETAFWDIGMLPSGAGKTVTLVPKARSDNPDGR